MVKNLFFLLALCLSASAFAQKTPQVLWVKDLCLYDTYPSGMNLDGVLFTPEWAKRKKIREVRTRINGELSESMSFRPNGQPARYQHEQQQTEFRYNSQELLDKLVRTIGTTPDFTLVFYWRGSSERLDGCVLERNGEVQERQLFKYAPNYRRPQVVECVYETVERKRAVKSETHQFVYTYSPDGHVRHVNHIQPEVPTQNIDIERDAQQNWTRWAMRTGQGGIGAQVSRTLLPDGTPSEWTLKVESVGLGIDDETRIRYTYKDGLPQSATVESSHNGSKTNTMTIVFEYDLES